MERDKIKIVIVDDHSLFSEGLATLLKTMEEVTVAKCLTKGLDTIEYLKAHHVDIVIMDISLPDINGIEVAKRLMDISTNIKTIFLSIHNEGYYVKKAKEIGAWGYLLKEDAFDELKEAIYNVKNGKKHFSKKVLYALKNKDKFSLTNREKEILYFVSKGYSNKQIAHSLGISTKTVEAHKTRIMKKLNIRSGTELIKFAIEHSHLY